MTTTPPTSASVPRALSGHRLDRRRIASYGALALTVALSLALRWWNLPYAEFQYDQAFSLGKAFDMVRRGVIPLAGIHSSVGSAQGPMEIYLLALPAALSQDPLVATAYVGLLQTIAVGGTYWLGARYFGRGAGLTASFLYAVNPWAVTYGRKIWTPSVMPLFTVLFLADCLCRVCRPPPAGLYLRLSLLFDSVSHSPTGGGPRSPAGRACRCPMALART